MTYSALFVMVLFPITGILSLSNAAYKVKIPLFVELGIEARPLFATAFTILYVIMILVEIGVLFSINIYVLHSKLLISERSIIIGSCNINRKSFTKLDELAVAVDNDDSPFAAEIRSSIKKAFQNAESVSDQGRISFNPILAFIEAAVM